MPVLLVPTTCGRSRLIIYLPIRIFRCTVQAGEAKCMLETVKSSDLSFLVPPQLPPKPSILTVTTGWETGISVYLVISFSSYTEKFRRAMRDTVLSTCPLYSKSNNLNTTSAAVQGLGKTLWPALTLCLLYDSLGYPLRGRTRALGWRMK